MVKEWAVGAGALFAVATVVRIVSVGKAWRRWVPGGIAVAVGKLSPFFNNFNLQVSDCLEL